MLHGLPRSYQRQEPALDYPHELNHEVLLGGVKGLAVDGEVAVGVAHDCVAEDAVADHGNLGGVGHLEVVEHVLVHVRLLLQVADDRDSVEGLQVLSLFVTFVLFRTH